MIDLIQSIVDVLTSIVNFVWNTLVSFITLLGHIPTYVDFLVSTFSHLPTAVMPFCIASVSVYVLFVVLGRN